ncbi:unnamed protein product [Ilex paraguariensis]|uniref:Glycosyltransferase n=1 Tax=Ilex paraguariensis TaxID=185542 RepID=A0ABC8T8R6_9AQUA
MEQTPHIAMIPSPGMGHLIPIVEFAKRFILQHNYFTITLVIPNDGPLSKAQNTFLEALPNGINYITLPPVNFDDLNDDIKVETKVKLIVNRSVPSVRNVLKQLTATTRLVALVADLFSTDAFDIAKEFKVSPFLFFPSTAMAMLFAFYLPKLDETVSCEYRDLPEPVKLPGCVPIHGRDLLDPVQDRKNDSYKWFLHHAKGYRLAEGIILNSFKDVEPGAIEALQVEEPGKPPVYPIGPLIQMGSSRETDGSGCLRWLDDQPSNSVLFISFGSVGTLSYDQLHELALGLELSEHRFLWVVRSPNEGAANATFFNAHGQDDPFDFLPKGFIDRTKGRGLVVPSWAPQAQILSHGSTGGFLTHCGWNSTLESVVSGIPLIAWPLYAEQKMNAVMLTDDMKVALRPKIDENGCDGSNGRSRREGFTQPNEDLKDAAAKALSGEGSSPKALAELACKWKNKISP